MTVETSIPTRDLVLGMARPDGSLAADEIYRAAAAAGMSGQQVRLCLRRLVLEGRYRQDGRGQRATFLPLREDAAELPDMAFVHFAYEQDTGRAPWDQTWHLVGFNVPEPPVRPATPCVSGSCTSARHPCTAACTCPPTPGKTWS